MAELQLSSINVNLLVVLDALLDESNVTRAARRMGITQSAMSHNLATLRGLLDDPLLQRGPDGMELTARARRIAAPLRCALEALQGSIQMHPPFDPASSRRRFTIATPDFLGTRLAAGVVHGVRAQAPGVEVMLRPLEWKRSVDALIAADLDMFVGPKLNDPVARQELLFAEEFVTVVREDHPTIRSSLSLEDYVEADHIMVSLENGGTSHIDGWLDRRGLSRKVSLRVPWFAAAPLIVARTDLVLTALSSTVDDELVRALGLRRFEPPVPLPPVPVMLTWHARHETDAGHAWMRALVCAQFEVARS